LLTTFPLVEAVGYVGRALGHYQQEEIGPYIIQSILILVSPALFAATIYMTLSRAMRSTAAIHHSIIKAKWLTTFFVTGDVVSFFVQGGGGGIIAQGAQDSANTGENIILAGLFIQIVLFGLFLVSAITFHSRLRKMPTPESLDRNLPWERMLQVLYVVSALILVRNSVRVAEFVGDANSYMRREEWPIYAFDALPMAAVMAVLFWWFPSMVCPQPGAQGRGLMSQAEDGLVAAGTS
jgi:heme/copper-type cytochrome/quinol oxidase subunit 2